MPTRMTTTHTQARHIPTDMDTTRVITLRDIVTAPDGTRHHIWITTIGIGR